MTTLSILVYGFIGDGFAQRYGFWKALVWPYFVGIVLSDMIAVRAALRDAEEGGE